MHGCNICKDRRTGTADSLSPRRSSPPLRVGGPFFRCMPRCIACGTQKPKSAFRKRPNGTSRGDCKQCEVVGSSGRRLRTRRANRALVNEYLEANPCIDCGETDPVVLEFDHRDRLAKIMPVAALIAQGYSWQSIKDEIDKCDVRCANCHRRRTSVQMNWYAARRTTRKRRSIR